MHSICRYFLLLASLLAQGAFADTPFKPCDGKIQLPLEVWNSA